MGSGSLQWTRIRSQLLSFLWKKEEIWGECPHADRNFDENKRFSSNKHWNESQDNSDTYIVREGQGYARLPQQKMEPTDPKEQQKWTHFSHRIPKIPIESPNFLQVSLSGVRAKKGETRRNSFIWINPSWRLLNSINFEQNGLKKEARSRYLCHLYFSRRMTFVKVE